MVFRSLSGYGTIKSAGPADGGAKLFVDPKGSSAGNLFFSARSMKGKNR